MDFERILETHYFLVISASSPCDTAMVMRVVSITSVSICQVSKHFFFVTQHVFQFVKNEKLSSSLIRIFKEIFVKLVLLLKPPTKVI